MIHKENIERQHIELLPYQDITTTFGSKVPSNFYRFSQPNYKLRNVVVVIHVFLGGRKGSCTLIDKPTLFSDKTVSC